MIAEGDGQRNKARVYRAVLTSNTLPYEVRAWRL